MLSEIYSEVFVNNDNIRKPIELGKGLNVVVGEDNGRNSIGKTTFLLAIDFALGGDGYLRDDGGMIGHIGHHEICFKHDFDGIIFSFLRRTDDSNTIWKCDTSYNKQTSITLNEYKDWLTAKYGFDGLGATFRDLQYPFFRIYGLEHDNVKRPLQSVSQSKINDDLRRVLRLFKRYGEIEGLIEIRKVTEDNKKAFKNAKERKLIRPAKNKTEYTTNAAKLKSLYAQMNDILDGCDTGTLDIDIAKEDRAARLRGSLKVLRRRRTYLNRKIAEIREDFDLIDFSETKNFEKLLAFFPEANIAALSEIEHFHKGITKILHESHREETDELQKELNDIEAIVKEKEEELSSLGSTTTLSSVVVDQYADLNSEAEQLSKANELYDQEKQFKEQLAKIDEETEETWRELLSSIQTVLNETMDNINSEIVEPGRTAPRIEFNGSKKYKFYVPNDGGTGTQIRGLYVFDLAMLDLTPLKFAIHDSHGMKQIEDNQVVKLFSLYSKSEKQVFVAIDKAQTYGANGKIPKVISDNTVLEISSGHELFGRSWYLKQKPNETSD